MQILDLLGMYSVALMLYLQVFTFSQIDLGPIVLVNLVYLCLTATMPTIFNTQARIVNGFDTGKALPYQLGLQNDVPNHDNNRFDNKYGCGGILISSKFGITADHCLDDTKNMDIDVRVFAGAYKWYGIKGFPAGQPCTSLDALTLNCTHQKVSEKKWATGQSCIRKRSTTCKIGTLVVAVGSSGILKAKQKLHVTFNSNKQDLVDLARKFKRQICFLKNITFW